MTLRRGTPGDADAVADLWLRARRAAADIPATVPARTGTTIFGKTVETVLGERPCRVIIESEPTR